MIEQELRMAFGAAEQSALAAAAYLVRVRMLQAAATSTTTSPGSRPRRLLLRDLQHLWTDQTLAHYHAHARTLPLSSFACCPDQPFTRSRRTGRPRAGSEPRLWRSG